MKKDDDRMVVKSYSTTIELWQSAKDKAEKNAQTMSAVIRRLLEKWLKGGVDINE